MRAAEDTPAIDPVTEAISFHPAIIFKRSLILKRLLLCTRKLTHWDGMDRYIAVDIGGTQIRAACCDSHGNILQRLSEWTPAHQDAESIMNCLTRTVQAVWPSDDPIIAMGVAVPGPLDPWEGVILHSPNIPDWDHFQLRAALQERFNVPVTIQDDANAAALAEHRFGAGRGKSHLVYLTIGTGVGNGIIINNELLLGGHGLAAEAGHMIIKEDAPIQCGCGNRGCLESLISGPSLAVQAQTRILSGEYSSLPELCGDNLEMISAQLINEAAQRGDPLAIDIFHQAGIYLGIAIVNLLYLFNPDIIIIGGSVSKAGELLLVPARGVVQQRCMPFYWQDTPILTAALDDDVGLLGAFCLVCHPS